MFGWHEDLMAAVAYVCVYVSEELLLRWLWFALAARLDGNLVRRLLPGPPLLCPKISRRQSVVGSARSRDVSGVGAFEFREVLGAALERSGFGRFPCHDHALTA